MKTVHRKYLAIGKCLKEKRELADLSQGDVMEIIGYKSPQLISDWERGICGPPIGILKKLTKAYEVSEKDLIDKILSAEKFELESLLKVRKMRKELSA